VYHVTGDGHRTLAALTTQLCEARGRFSIQADPGGIFSRRDDESAMCLGHPNGWRRVAPNVVRRIVSAFTLAYRMVPTDADMAAVDSIVREQGATIRWQTSHAFGRAYALIERASPECREAVREQTEPAYVDRPIIALAVSPSIDEALPPILHALGGPGAPAGIRSCEAFESRVIVEWDLDRTPAEIVMGLIDVEIARFCARRVNELLSPLSLTWVARIAADGLRAPEIAPDRILEHLLGGLDAAG
jgi:hypothetical protein